MQITDDIIYIGVNDHQIDLFEGQYDVPLGMAYNSYVILDEKIAVMDTVDRNFAEGWLANLDKALAGRTPDYLVVQHMEPDHSANIQSFLAKYPNVTVVGNEKTFAMIGQFFAFEDGQLNKLVVDDGDTLALGKHELMFVFAPMVHWPEVMVTYDSRDKVLFSADAFGKFGANDVEDEKGWACEARRYYMGIVGKYGEQVQDLLKKAGGLDIQVICPLHGPVLLENLDYYLGLYNTWSAYEPEDEGVLIAYTSVYGHTAEAVLKLAKLLEDRACPKVSIIDLAREDRAEAVEDAFRYSKVVFATTTYNAEVFPPMREFINELAERNFKNRTVAFVENGTWAPSAAKVMKDMLAGCEKLKYAKNTVTIHSALDETSEAALTKLADELCREYIACSPELADKRSKAGVRNIGYGLYVVTCNDGMKDNGMICNTVTQIAGDPQRIAVSINKANYSHDVIKQTGILNVNNLSEECPFSVFERFGFQSGRDVDKFAGEDPLRSDNGLAFLPKWSNSFMSLKVEDYLEMGSHGVFICSVTESRSFSDVPTMSYSYYHANVKPKPKPAGKKGFICTICGYIYEGDTLPPDFVCLLCKHGAADFRPL